MALDLDYIDVASRIVEFRTKHPDGALQPADLTKPYAVETIGDQTFIVVIAAAYRTADDPRPGIGMAYELFPGKTNFTRGSELQNAETSAWGRAIVAALAADTKKGIASAEEVRNRQAERENQEQRAAEMKAAANDIRDKALDGADVDELRALYKTASAGGLLTVPVVNEIDEPEALGALLIRRSNEVGPTDPAGTPQDVAA